MRRRSPVAADTAARTVAPAPGKVTVGAIGQRLMSGRAGPRAARRVFTPASRKSSPDAPHALRTDGPDEKIARQRRRAAEMIDVPFRRADAAPASPGRGASRHSVAAPPEFPGSLSQPDISPAPRRPDRHPAPSAQTVTLQRGVAEPRHGPCSSRRLGHRGQRPLPPSSTAPIIIRAGPGQRGDVNAFSISIARRAHSSPACSMFPALSPRR